MWQQPLANQLGGFEYNFRCLKRFFRKVRRKLRSAFSLKLRFLKIRLLVTWLKCLSRQKLRLNVVIFQQRIIWEELFQIKNMWNNLNRRTMTYTYLNRTIWYPEAENKIVHGNLFIAFTFGPQLFFNKNINYHLCTLG